MGKVYKVGIIGCGRMADTIEDEQLERRKKHPYRGGLVLPYAHAAGYAAVEETEVVAACDIDATRLRAFVDRWKVKSYVDYREMIEKEDLDIVSVATRPEQHAEQMIFAANHGIAGIYAEKPLCMSLRETDAIRAAFEHNQVHLEYGPIYRHWTACEQARVLGEKGALGEIKAVLGFEGKALEGHFIDLLLYLLGDPEPACYLLELSSFQLETTSSLVAEVAAILNISPDHMDRYPNLNAYAAAKTRIAGSASTLILNRDDSTLVSLVAMPKVPNLVTFGLSCPPSGKDLGVVQQNSADWLIRGSEALLPAADLKIEGRHNIANALAALAIADTIVCGDIAKLVGPVREFTGLPHRCEIVGEIRGVRWINDSKGTNVGATVAALEGMGRPVVLIAGGQAKNADFGPLAKSAQRFARQVVLFGEDREQIGKYLSLRVPVTTVTTLDEATRLAAEWAQPGDVVLFSPACASFDMFDNFEHRGDTFRELVSGVNQ